MQPASTRYLLSAVGVLALAGASSSVEAQSPQRSLAYVSEPGDPIGQGRTGTALPRFSYAHADAIYIAAFDGAVHYDLSLVPPQGQQLRAGVYQNARGGTLAAPGHPGLYFSSDQACDGTEGRFEITDIAFDESGQVVRLRANFEQRCAGSTGTLWGDVALDAGLTRYSAALEQLGRHDAADAVAYMVVECSVRALGHLRVRASQKAPDGSVVAGGSSRSFGCGAEPTRVALDLMTAGSPGWRPGPVEVEVESYVNDPHYDEASRVMRRAVQGTVILTPGRE